MKPLRRKMVWYKHEHRTGLDRSRRCSFPNGWRIILPPISAARRPALFFLGEFTGKRRGADAQQPGLNRVSRLGCLCASME